MALLSRRTLFAVAVVRLAVAMGHGEPAIVKIMMLTVVKSIFKQTALIAAPVLLKIVRSSVKLTIIP